MLKKTNKEKAIKDLLKEKDAFLTNSEKFLEYFMRHTKAFITAGVILVLLIIGVAFYVKYQDSAEKKASRAYEVAVALESGDSTELEPIIKALENVRSEHKGRKAERLAAFSLIPLYDRSGQTKKALATTEEMLTSLKKHESSLNLFLLSLVAEFSEITADFQKSADTYKSMLNESTLPPAMAVDIEMNLGRVLSSLKQNDEAIKVYENIVKKYPQSLNVFIANNKIAELKGERPDLIELEETTEEFSEDENIETSGNEEVQ